MYPVEPLKIFILEKLAVAPGFSDWSRLTLVALVIFIPGALMGVLFPAGLRLLAETEQSSIPWSWAINGLAAVIGGICAKLLAIAFGYRMVLVLAIGCYILSGIISW